MYLCNFLYLLDVLELVGWSVWFPVNSSISQLAALADQSFVYLCGFVDLLDIIELIDLSMCVLIVIVDFVIFSEFVCHYGPVVIWDCF